MATAGTVRRFATALSATLGVAALIGVGAAPAAAAETCTRVAAPSGSDGAPGTEAAPYRTAQKLVDSVSAGQTACLRSGTFTQSVKISRAGIRLTSFPGERARLVGRLWIARGADGVTVSSLDLDGTNAARTPGPTVNAHGATFEDNDVTNGHRAESCFILGGETYGRADRVTIRRNRIHDCGALPATNHDHGIYVAVARDGEITDNVIYDNADRGIQLYPDADDFEIKRNVIDGNGQGVIFSGDDGEVSSGNTVENNIITNARIRHNVESFWPDDLVGSGNVARNNCLWGGVRSASVGGVQLPSVGFTLEDNLVVDPRYENRSNADFDLEQGSPCRRVLRGDAPDLPPPGNDEGPCPPTSVRGSAETGVEAVIGDNEHPTDGGDEAQDGDESDSASEDDGEQAGGEAGDHGGDADSDHSSDAEDAEDADSAEDDEGEYSDSEAASETDERADASDESDGEAGDSAETGGESGEADGDSEESGTSDDDGSGDGRGSSGGQSSVSDSDGNRSADDETTARTHGTTRCRDRDPPTDHGSAGSSTSEGGGGSDSGGGGSGGGGSGGDGSGGGSADAAYDPGAAPLTTGPIAAPTPGAGSTRSRSRRCAPGRRTRRASTARRGAGRGCARRARRARADTR